MRRPNSYGFDILWKSANSRIAVVTFWRKQYNGEIKSWTIIILTNYELRKRKVIHSKSGGLKQDPEKWAAKWLKLRRIEC